MHRMSLHEVEEVARLAAGSGVRPQGGGPTVHKVADALGMAPSDVEFLLDQARQGRAPIRDFKIVLGLVVLVVAFLSGIGFTSLFGRHSATPAAAVSSSPVSSSTSLPSSTLAPTTGPVAHLVRPGTAEVATTQDNAPSQLSGTLAPLEAKTLEGDVNRAKRRANLSASALPADGSSAGQPMALRP